MPIIQRFIAVYKLWDEFVTHFPKKSKYTLGEKIDSLFIDTIELLFTASYLNKEQKLPYLQKASGKLDLLKFFLQIAWELKAIDNQKYIVLSKQLDEIGKMLGGWTRGIQKETPSR
ncbi:MAG: diversity-generating retroelement protein Avd [Candidatus Azambacteria bacterium]|nr:diversity-generating retroelement protein Avd [Candidatus Azambacteria bacterium]